MSAQPRDILQPFRVAISGVVYTFRTQRHMRVHLYVTLTVVIAALLLNLRIKDLLVLLFMINFVLVAEMFNSAIEATVERARHYGGIAREVGREAKPLTTSLGVAQRSYRQLLVTA